MIPFFVCAPCAVLHFHPPTIHHHRRLCEQFVHDYCALKQPITPVLNVNGISTYWVVRVQCGAVKTGCLRMGGFWLPEYRVNERKMATSSRYNIATARQKIELLLEARFTFDTQSIFALLAVCNCTH